MRHTQLLSTRRVATGLLLLMGLVLLGIQLFAPKQPGWSYLLAFTEAALVGGLADWFAVTALFRHPLGLPIPHTAIIPSNRHRLADSIADFLGHNFLNREVLNAEVTRIDFAGLLGAWLSDAVHRRWLVRRSLGQGTDWLKPGPLLAEVLEVFIGHQRHELIFDRLIMWGVQLLNAHQADIYQKVSEKSPRWMPRRLNDEFFHRLIDGIAELLADMQQPNSSAREQFRSTLLQLADQLRSTDGAIEGWFSGLLAERRISRHLESVLQELGVRLVADEVLRTAVNQWLHHQTVSALVAQRHQIVGLVRRVVLSWDAQTIVSRVEQHVGRDLQFIRINGTLVGGMVGLILKWISSLG